MDYNYESDHTKFIREKRKAARSMWWDKKLNKEEQKRFKESNEPMKPYVYFGG